MFSSRRARVATFIAAGVIGFGGVAAAGGGLRVTDPDDTPDVTPAPQEIEVEEIEADVVEVEEVDEVTTTTAAAEIEESDDDAFTDEVARATLAAAAQDVAVDDVDDPETAFDENDCLEGNHGRTVSAVAHGDDPFQDVEVRDAAQSQCGKADADEVDDAAEVDDADEVDEADDADEADEADEVDEADDARPTIRSTRTTVPMTRDAVPAATAATATTPTAVAASPATTDHIHGRVRRPFPSRSVGRTFDTWGDVAIWPR